jgi:ribosomal protein S18 acetylase RimI-like enzyme
MGTVRKMSLEDVEDVVSVFVESFEDSWNRYERNYYPRKALEFDFSRITPEYCKKRIQESNDFLFVVEENGKIAGAAIGGIMRGNDKEGGLVMLSSICIHPLHQRKGLGEALLDHVIKYCEQQKCHKITLYTLPVLVPAMNLYLKLGFVPEAYLRKEWWNIDFLKMSKWL